MFLAFRAFSNFPNLGSEAEKDAKLSPSPLCAPNQQRTLNKPPPELRCKIFATKHRLSMRVGRPNVQERACDAYMRSDGASTFACRRCCRLGRQYRYTLRTSSGDAQVSTWPFRLPVDICASASQSRFSHNFFSFFFFMRKKRCVCVCAVNNSKLLHGLTPLSEGREGGREGKQEQEQVQRRSQSCEVLLCLFLHDALPPKKKGKIFPPIPKVDCTGAPVNLLPNF